MTQPAPIGATHRKPPFAGELRARTRPWPGWTGRLREASAERAVVLDCPPEQALPHVWDSTNVERCERKADRVTVAPETA